MCQGLVFLDSGLWRPEEWQLRAGEAPSGSSDSGSRIDTAEPRSLPFAPTREPFGPQMTQTSPDSAQFATGGDPLSSPGLDLGTASLEAGVDWTVVGLLLAIAGCFLLANSILFRPSRELVEEYVGGRARSLQSIRGYLFHRVQVTIGFLLLIGGFSAQLTARVAGGPAPQTQAGFPLEWFGAILGLVVALEIGGWWLSRRLFQRELRRLILDGDLRLENDSKLVREVGELFGVPLRPEDTVQSYAARVREQVHLPERWTINEVRPRPAASEPAVGAFAGADEFEGL